MEIARLQIAVDALQAKAAKIELDKLSGSAGKAEKSAKATTSAMSGLNKVLAATAGLITVRAIIQASDQYGQMAARIRMATSSTEEYEAVQVRLLDTANNTFRALSEAQELYIRTADAIRSLGFNTEEVLDITDSFSYLLVTNAASADRAASAINAYSKAIATGRVDSETWQSILAATPTIVDDIARATGTTAEEIRKLGISGKLSLSALNEALLQSRDRNEDLAASMETSVADATTALANSFQVFIGKVNETSGASGILTDQIGELASILQDPKTIEAAQQLAAGVVSALNGIIDVTKDVVSGVRWMGEELSVAMGGIGLHDVDRLEAEASKIQGLMDKVRGEGFGPGSAIFDNLLGSFEENDRRLQQAYGLLDIQTTLNKEQVAAPETALKMQRAAVAAAALATGTKKLTTEQREQIKAARELAQAQESNSDTLTDLEIELHSVALSARDLAMLQGELALNEYATSEQIKSARDLAAAIFDAEKAKASAKSNVELLGQVDPIVGEQQGFQKELDDLRMLNEAKLIEDARYLELKGQAERAHAEQMRILQEENFRAQSTQNEILFASIDQLGAATTDVITGLVTGANNGEEAIRALAGSILNEAVGAVVEMGIQYVKSAVMGQAAATAGAATALATGLTTATALSAAYATPAALVSLATFGANAAAASAGIASTVGLSQALSLASFEGGGFTGSGPRSGGMDGKGGFMAMVHPNETVIDHTKESANSGGGVTVNVIESKDKAGTQEKRTDADGKESVDVFVSDIYGDGPRSKAMQRAFGLQRQGQ